MRRLRSPLFVLVVAVLACLLIAAGPALPTAADGAKRYKLLAARTDGTYYAVAEALCSKLPDEVAMDPVVSDGSVGNLIMTSIGHADFCLTQADALVFMRGQEEYASGLEKLLAVLPLFHEEVHLIARKTAKIRSLADLAGKRVNLGPGASGSYVTAIILLDQLGLSESVITSQRTHPDALERLLKGELDAMWVTGGAPLPFLAQITEEAGAQIELVPFTKAQQKELTTGLPYWSARIRAGTYSWQGAGPVPTISTLCLLLAHEDVPNRTVEIVARTALREAKGLVDTHTKWREVRVQEAKLLLITRQMKFHPGAAKAIREP